MGIQLGALSLNNAANCLLTKIPGYSHSYTLTSSANGLEII